MPAVQTPVTYRVTDTVLNGGSYPGGYRIINLSLKATVYASNNPGMGPGQGTVINPGTSVAWTRGGDLYLILGDDTLSTDVGYCDVTLSYDVGDWQPNPVAIASAALNRQERGSNNISLGSGDVLVDASLFSSIIVQHTPAASAYPEAFRISWYYSIAERDADTGVFWQDQWVYTGDPDSGNTPGMSLQIPLRSPYLRISGTGFLSYSLTSLHVQDLRYCVNNDFGDATTFDGILLMATGGAVAAGSAGPSHFLDFPYTGDVDIFVRVSAGAPPNGQIRITEHPVGEIDIRGLTAAFVQVPNNAGIAFRTSFASRQVSIRLVNNSAGAVAWTSYLIFVKAVNQFRGN